MRTPVCFPALYGNQKLKEILGKDILAERYSHAYILEGPKGSGKKTAALQIAAAINCTSRDAETLPCGRCYNCRKIFRQICPDVFRINDSDHASIGVEIIRSIKQDLFTPPNDTEKKVYIFEECERMTVQAQNALLLSLEEPPEFVFFLLLTDSASRLLPTIRSRAPVLSMQLFSPQDILSYLSSVPATGSSVSAEKQKTAASLSAGTIGNALSLLSDASALSAADRIRETATRFANAMILPIRAETVELMTLIPRKDQRAWAVSLLENVLLILRDYISLKKARHASLLFLTDTSEASALLRTIPVSRLLNAFEATYKAKSDVEANGSVSLIFTTLLLTKKTE